MKNASFEQTVPKVILDRAGSLDPKMSNDDEQSLCGWFGNGGGHSACNRVCCRLCFITAVLKKRKSLLV
ncbi:MAG: hypothetical protein NZL95_06765 [Chitinophagales bacterium]|nr:hypothetical protein [Chitinophagales bacterium]MDW8428239.1 hypothetical protein [Chitinophagales bacterium]